MSLALRGTRRRCSRTILMASRRISTTLLKKASSGASGKAATKMVVKPYWITAGGRGHPELGVGVGGPFPAPPHSPPRPHPRTHLHELIEQAEGVHPVQAVVALPAPQLGVFGLAAPHGAILESQPSGGDRNQVGDGRGGGPPGGGRLWEAGWGGQGVPHGPRYSMQLLSVCFRPMMTAICTNRSIMQPLRWHCGHAGMAVRPRRGSVGEGRQGTQDRLTSSSFHRPARRRDLPGWPLILGRQRS